MLSTSSQGRQNRRNLVIISILSFVNVLFFFKYVYRILGAYTYFLTILLFMVSMSTLLPFVRKVLQMKTIRWLLKYCLIIIPLFVLFTHLKIPLEQLNVDRWSVIYSFWQELLAGNYPYYAVSHMGNPPGPMPVYFLLALPFYTVGWLEILSALGPLAVGYWLVTKFGKAEWAEVALSQLLLATWLYWEIATRSNVFTYSALITLGLIAFERSAGTNDKRWRIAYALLCGLLLATRSAFAVAYIFVFGKETFTDLRNIRKIIHPVVALLAFAGVFVPFALIWPGDFWVINPFIVQSDFLLPSGIVYCYLGVALIVTLLLRSTKSVQYVCGWLLFSLILLYFVYQSSVHGISTAYLDSKIDLSYFLFCVPPFLYSLIIITHPTRPT